MGWDYILLVLTSVITQLRSFNFRFLFPFQRTLDLTSERIQSFKSNYWCIDKKWYVAVYSYSIFTVPHFSPHTIVLLASLHCSYNVWTNSPYQEICYENAKTIAFDEETLEKSQKEKHIYYENMEHIIWCHSSKKENKS
jgi:hypothetical protein